MLIHTCTLVRPSYSTDAYDNELADYDSPAQTLTKVRCRLVEKQKTWITDERSESLVVTESKMLFPPGTDLQARDRVTKVTLEDGTVVSAVFEIRQPPVTRRGRSARHLSAQVKRLS